MELTTRYNLLEDELKDIGVGLARLYVNEAVTHFETGDLKNLKKLYADFVREAQKYDASPSRNRKTIGAAMSGEGLSRLVDLVDSLKFKRVGSKQ